MDNISIATVIARFELFSKSSSAFLFGLSLIVVIIIDVKQLFSLNWGLRFPIILLHRYHQLAVDARMLLLVVSGL